MLFIKGAHTKDICTDGILSHLAKNYENYQPKIRPQKSTRPRTKTRPLHEDALPAFVIEAHLGRWLCVTCEGKKIWCVRARELGKHPIVVGDTVFLVGDTSGAKDTLARIVKILDRTTMLRRSADDTDSSERIVVAGCDQLLIVVATISPEPKPTFIYRAAMAAFSGGCTPVIAITKTDQANPTMLMELAQNINIPCFAAGIDDDISPLQACLTDKITALFGQSGVGKSTLFNRLIPGADRATGEVSAIGKGRHTSSTALALPFPLGGWLIDTPGLRSLGLNNLTLEKIYLAIPHIQEVANRCPKGCQHRKTTETSTTNPCHLRTYYGPEAQFIEVLLDILNNKNDTFRY